MDIMNLRARENFKYYEEFEFEDVSVSRMIERLDWNVRDDQKLFDGASKEFVRNHLKKWVDSSKSNQERKLIDAATEFPLEGAPERDEDWVDAYRFTDHTPPRYKFAIRIDAEALDSVVSNTPYPPDAGYFGYINLIQKDWEMADPNAGEDDPIDDEKEPIEGCRRFDVGWMKVATAYMIPEGYASFGTQGHCYIVYRRLPEICDQ
jgi:hypothetical protein